MPLLPLRRATPEDAAALCALGRETFHDAFSASCGADDLAAYLAQTFNEARTANALQDSGVHHFVIEDNGSLVAYVKFGALSLPVPSPVHPSGELHRLYVRRDYQRRRLGARLLETFLSHGVSHNWKQAYLGVWEHNLRAIAFYRRYGFEQIAQYPFPIGKQVDTDLIFAKTLSG